MPQRELSVEQDGPNLWKIRYSDSDDKVIENYVVAKDKPEVRWADEALGAVVLYDQDNKEVGRYDVIWVGHEPPCEHVGENH